jgi:Pretoxin HINT domain
MKTWMQSMMLGLMAMLMPVASGVQAASLPQDSQGSYSLATHSPVQSQEEVAIHTTGAHPFWSETRHAWVSARDLQAGEELRSQDGEEMRVASLGRIPGAQPVFNLEVESEDVYFVSEAGVLVHNSYADTLAKLRLKGFSKGELGEHFRKHGDEFPGMSQQDYLKRAKEFAAAADPNHKVDGRGPFLIKYDPSTKEILIVNKKDREIRTLYKDDGRDPDPWQAALDYATALSTPNPTQP